MSESLLKPNERVLSTLNEDGSRRWLKPRPSRGRFWWWRRIVAYALIAIFAITPFTKVNGKQTILLDLMNREFTFFGKTLYPHDTLLLGLFLIMLFVTIFLVTALFGRVWCGWICPQTVYMEYVFRPIERLFEGDPSKRTPRKQLGLRRVLRFVVYLIVSAHLAQTFLAYFVGTEQLHSWILGSPFNHPVAFLVVASTTGLMLFDFGFFREQVCCVVCPYARMQSVLLDQDSLIITYDEKRGEPRGKKRRKPADDPASSDITLPQLGDCIDCTMCVQTCPTGIDIRDGLQLECIGCAQCIDACDAIMDKIGRPRGLIRYSSERAVKEGKAKFVRPRIVIYPMILAALFTAFLAVLQTTSDASVWIGRERGLPFYTLPSGEITNQLRTRITNRNEESRTYTISIVDPEGVRISEGYGTLEVEGGQEHSASFPIVADASMFAGGPFDVTIRVEDGLGFSKDSVFEMKGPATTIQAEQPEGENDG
jgi:cytochrome c oxidase accessory protein FixG